MNDLKIVAEEESKVLTENQSARELALSYLKSMGLNIPEQFQMQFIEIASAMKLNPFLNEIHAISFSTKDGPVFKCVTGYMVYIKRAERTGKLNGWEVSSTTTNNGQMVSTVTIYRKDWEKPFRHSVRFNEVAQYSPSGELSRLWKKMPAFMCEKACISQGFRLCFPDELAGMPYTTEEMPEGVMLGTAQPIQSETPEQKTIPIQTPEQMGMQRASQLPQTQLKGGESTETEKKEIKALFATKYANGVPVFTLEEMKELSAMRAEQYTAQEFIVFLKQELSRRLGL